MRRRDSIRKARTFRLSDEASEALQAVADALYSGNASHTIEQLALEAAKRLRNQRDQTPIVTSWSPVRMADVTTCADCKRDIGIGAEAFIERLSDGSSGAVICAACVEA